VPSSPHPTLPLPALWRRALAHRSSASWRCRSWCARARPTIRRSGNAVRACLSTVFQLSRNAKGAFTRIGLLPSRTAGSAAASRVCRARRTPRCPCRHSGGERWHTVLPRYGAVGLGVPAPAPRSGDQATPFGRAWHTVCRAPVILGVLSRRFSESVYQKTRPVRFPTAPAAVPIVVFFFDAKGRCIYCCRLSSRFDVREEMLKIACMGIRITASQMRESVRGDYSIVTRRFR